MTRHRPRFDGPLACAITHLWPVALLASVAEPNAVGRTLEIESAYTVVGQESDDDALEESTTGSLDVYLGWNRGTGRFEAYLEANTSLKDDGVATRVPRSNADAGTALDRDRSGRLQLSELKYRHRWRNERSISAGLLDPSAYLDATRINNDENLQFLGASFVNNPTIEFPDYTLGIAARLPSAAGRQTWNLVLAGSNGIADNPNLSYSQVLNVTDDDKGLFAGAEAAWPSRRLLARAGGWVNTSSHETLDGEEDDAVNYGVYSAVGASRGRWAANLRVGLADPDVSIVEGFASVSFQWDLGRRVLGLAAAHSWISSEATAATPDDSRHLEAYLRFEPVEALYLTPSIQYLVHPTFDASGTSVDDHVMVYSLRLHHVFVRRD